ncbi:MAG TPA: hypothetical protein VFL14_04965 [Xanthomonadales bacterium]|nr:hypothetical protein [Xanthomonadales bacterium]
MTITWIALAWLLAAPLLALPWLARVPGARAAPVSWRSVFASMLWFVVAFDVVFLVQELFLVVPKALTPGLVATLFHNNHSWTGTDPRAALFQGTGALATLVLGLACALALRAPARRTGTRLLLGWIAYCGALMALPQVVIGAQHEGNDVGMAFAYLGLAPPVKLALAVLVLLAIPPLAAWLARAFLALAPDARDARGRLRALWRLVALPALLAQPIVVAFRVPRDWQEVVLLPLIVVACGVPWMLAAGAASPLPIGDRRPEPPSVAVPAVLALLLLAVFQLVLRHGVTFG